MGLNKTKNSSLNCIKVLHYIVIVYILCVSLCLIGIGIYLISSFHHYDFTKDHDYTIIPIILLCSGFVSILVCILGIFGSKVDNLCLIKLYAAIMCIMLIMELCIAIAAAILRTNLENYATNTVNDLMSNYANDINAETQLNQIQKQYECCGANSVVDYLATNMTTPSSCCSAPPCADKNIYPKMGCISISLLTSRC
ncbi:unnamed protein product [Hymenolepis diminuta]|uniref:Tetraspanin n=1 Tax=Hymenolepis diminuta TaxID=6216 RepID=A0A564Z2Q6_HYMDI|nr:unnamed protein product [Hymenolepis diminuta]